VAVVEFPALPDLLVLLEKLALPELKDLKVPKVLLVLMELKASPAKKDRWDLMDLLVPKDPLVLLVLTVRRSPLKAQSSPWAICPTVRLKASCTSSSTLVMATSPTVTTPGRT
tara:strand:- start:152 stop:490 length:339 start_codon:yes stop_codon:yes gene_type:complete